MCLFRADGGPTLLEESIADLLGEQGAYCRADDRLTLPGESIAESCLTLWRVEVTWSHSSVGPILVPWRTKQLDFLDNSTLPSFLMSPVISPLFCMEVFMN